ncbi:MAG: tol-pal system protein YbgF [Pseudomonadota bacterium]
MKRSLSIFALGALAISMASAPAPAAAGTKDRVTALEKTVAELQARAAADNSAVRINQLERQVQDLTGLVEKLTFQLDQANARLDAVSGVLANDPAAAAAASGGPTPLTGGDPIADQISAAGGAPSAATAVSLPGDPAAAFDYASGFLLRGDYDSARAAFEGYVQAFPNSPQTADAQFRLGEIYLATGANADAADAFIAHIRNYPNDPRAAEAYLKLGTSFARLEKNAEACKVFKTMRGKFPNAAPPVTDRANIEMARIQCS